MGPLAYPDWRKLVHQQGGSRGVQGQAMVIGLVLNLSCV